MVYQPAVFQAEPFVTEREWTVEEIPVLSASMRLPLPQPQSAGIFRRIRRYYQLQCRAFLRYCEHALLPQAKEEFRLACSTGAPLPHFRAELDYRITYHEGRLWSLYTQSREETLPGRTLLTRRGDTWDLVSGYPVALREFFPRRAPWRNTLLTCAAGEIARQERCGIALYHEGWRHRLRRAFNSQNYYLTGEGIAFFFPMYTIAPAAAGIPTFLLPYTSAGIQPAPPEETADTAP